MSTGWICPKCDRGVNPTVEVCPCAPTFIGVDYGQQDGERTVTTPSTGWWNNRDGYVDVHNGYTSNTALYGTTEDTPAEPTYKVIGQRPGTHAEWNRKVGARDETLPPPTDNPDSVPTL